MLAHIAAGGLVEVVDALVHLVTVFGGGLMAVLPAAFYALWQRIRRKRT